MPLFKKRASRKLVEEAVENHEQKNLQQAKELFLKAIETYDKNPEAHLLYGDLLKDMNEMKPAENEYKRAIEIKPDFAEAHGALGELLHRLGRIYEAETAYKKSIELKPHYVNSSLNLATLYMDLAAFESMKKVYREVLPYVEDEGLKRRIEEKLRY